MRLGFLHHLWKLPVCGLAFMVGIVAGSLVAGAAGMSTPDLPAGADEATLQLYALVGSVILALALAGVSRGLSGRFLTRWLALSFLTWIAYGVNTYLEAAIFTTMSAASPFMVVMYAGGSVSCGAAVAWLFPPGEKGAGFLGRARAFFSGRGAAEWAWRLAGALLAFPLAYLTFGRLIAPLVTDYYRRGMMELTLPGWDQILPVLLLRSLLFLLACLPVLIAWQESRRRLFVTLGLTLFLLVGGVYMLQAYWLPATLRLVHSLEILADELVYAGALVVLLVKATPARQVAPAG